MKDIKGYEGLYAITSCGKVWSYRRKMFLRPNMTNSGYLIVRLSKEGHQKGFLIHRLVAEAYIPNPNNLPCVNHKDECKTHNYTNNLEWITHKDNLNYGTAISKQNEKKYQKVMCIETKQVFNSLQDACEWMGLNRRSSALSQYFAGKTKTCGGYTWQKL